MHPTRDSLYGLLPAVIRQRDQAADKALEQLLAIIDGQVESIERDLDRMYENWFIETCDDWVVPYLGDLLGYELPAGAIAPGQGSCALAKVLAPRREVGNLIAQRRRKGTASVLASIAGDIAGWPARAVEYYQRLVVAQHLDHLQPDRLALIDVFRGVELLRPGSPFGAACGIVDVRSIGAAQSRGRFNIANVGLHVYRMRRYPVTGTPAYCREDRGRNCFTFSLLGNDAPLYRLARTARDASEPIGVDQVPLPIQRFELESNDAIDQADPALYGVGASIALNVQGWPTKGEGGDIPAEAILPADLSDWSYRVPEGRIAVDPVLGRIMFADSQRPARGVRVNVSYGYGFAMDLGGGEYPRTFAPMPAATERAVVHAIDVAPAAGQFASVALALADWQQRRDKGLPPEKRAAPALLIELLDSGEYRGSLVVELQAGESVWVVAANGRRPVLWLADFNAGSSDAITVSGAKGSRFVLDGVLVAGRGIDIMEPPVAGVGSGVNANPNANANANEISAAAIAATADNDLCEVLIRHTTMVPGWGLNHDCEPMRPTEPSITIDGSRTCVRIEHSIVGAIRVSSDRQHARRARIVIEDSIVDATSETRAAISEQGDRVAAADLCVARSTLIGMTLVHSVARADNSIFAGTVQVARRQRGCIRYCYVPAGSRTPRRHHCQPETAIQAIDERIAEPDETLDRAALRDLAMLRVRPDFVSVRYGTADYLRLHADTAIEISQGADDASEQGVYHDLFEPQRIALLEARLADAVPAGADSAVLLET